MATTNETGGKAFLTKLSDLNELARKSKKKKLAVAVAHDEHCLEAICAVDRMGLVEAILIGNEKKIHEIAGKLNLDVSAMKIINEEMDAISVKIAVKMVRNKEADILMKGNVPTAVFLRGVLDKENGLRKGDVLSHFALFEIPTYHKLYDMLLQFFHTPAHAAFDHEKRYTCLSLKIHAREVVHSWHVFHF